MEDYQQIVRKPDAKQILEDQCELWREREKLICTWDDICKKIEKKLESCKFTSRKRSQRFCCKGGWSYQLVIKEQRVSFYFEQRLAFISLGGMYLPISFVPTEVISGGLEHIESFMDELAKELDQEMARTASEVECSIIETRQAEEKAINVLTRVSRNKK